MTAHRRILIATFWIVTPLLFVGTIMMLVFYTPAAKIDNAGPAQKIFYFHLPVAINTFVCALIVFIASIGYLWQRKMWWDDLAVAAGKITVLFCSVVLLTGMIWGRSFWGPWWTWSPRLTLSLVLWLLYLVYLMIRPAIESPQRRALVSAVYGIAAFLDVPVVYLSTKLIPSDIHPKLQELDPLTPEMKLTLWVWFLPVTMLMIGLVVARYKLNRRQRELRVIPPDEEEAVFEAPSVPGLITSGGAS